MSTSLPNWKTPSPSAMICTEEDAQAAVQALDLLADAQQEKQAKRLRAQLNSAWDMLEDLLTKEVGPRGARKKRRGDGCLAHDRLYLVAKLVLGLAFLTRPGGILSGA